MKPAFVLATLLVWSQSAAGQEIKSATLHIDRIQCIACAATVKKALNAVPGVRAVNVDVEKKEVIVQFDAARTGVPELAQATKKHGFPAQVRNRQP